MPAGMAEPGCCCTCTAGGTWTLAMVTAAMGPSVPTRTQLIYCAASMLEHIWRSGGAVGVLQGWVWMVGRARTDERRAGGLGVATLARREQRCQLGECSSGAEGRRGRCSGCRWGWFVASQARRRQWEEGVWVCGRVGWMEVVVGLATMSRGAVLGWRRAVLAAGAKRRDRESKPQAAAAAPASDGRK